MSRSKSLAVRVTSVVTAVGVATLGMVVAVAPAAHAAPSCTNLFEPTSGSYIGDTPGSYICTVPAGVTAYAVDMRGGYGGSRNAIWGGLGAKLTGKINVTPGADLTVDVADNGIIIDNTGGGGSNGGSGGGYSAIQTTSGPIVVAGGGGGDGNDGGGQAAGGNAGAGTTGNSVGQAGANDGNGYAFGGQGATNSTGGAGGTSYQNYGNGGTGGASGTAGGAAAGGSQPNGSGGGGGLNGAGGATSGSCSVTVAPGAAPGGGDACTSGGGGGGYAGGGGGAGLQQGSNSGGGGGSSFFPAGITATTAFVDNADKAPRVALVVAFGVASVSPLEGPAAGGTSITITGTEFTADATVTVGGAACTPVVFVSTTEISCTTTAHAAGAADVAVTVGGETVTMTSAFTFTGSDTPAASVCPLTLVKPLPARKRLPVGKPIQLLKGARTVSSCTLRLNSSGRIATRGDMRGVRIVVNKRTGRVVALATTRNAKAKLTVVATPKLAPYNQRSDRFARSWTS